MAFWSRKRRTASGSLDRAADRTDLAHLEDFLVTRRGVEGFVEPATSVTATTLVLVAHDGEWTRRRVADRQAAFDLCRKHAIPVYDAAVRGYPQRMRDWSARTKPGNSAS
jgi:hypothetical protein